MRVGLSPFLQARFNLFLYRTLGWKIGKFYIFSLGRLYYFLNKKEKDLVRTSLSEVIGRRNPEMDIDRMTSEVFRGILSHYYEKLYIAYEEKEKASLFLKNNIASQDLDKLRGKLSETGRGLIMVTAHYGAIEYIPTLLAVNGLPVSMIAKFKTEQLKRKIFEQAEKYGIVMIDGKESGNVLGTAVGELRKNRILVTQCDEIEEWRPSPREKTSFLSRIVGVDRTINIMHKRSGAEPVFGVLFRHNLEEYQLMVHDCREMADLLFLPQGRSVGEVLLKFLEQYIYTHPTQWYEWKKYARIREFPSSERFVDLRPVPLLVGPYSARAFG